MASTDLTSLEDVKRQAGIADALDDLWLAGAIAAVSSVMETATKRWLAPRGTLTRLFDGGLARDPSVLPVPHGLQSLTYLGVADTDQPDDGTGAYTAITTGYYLRGRLADGWPATRIELGATATRGFPSSGYNAIKVTGAWGPEAVLPRIRELATSAVVRAYRAKADGRGSPDIAVVGPEGGLTVLRRIAPAA